MVTSYSIFIDLTVNSDESQRQQMKLYQVISKLYNL